MLDTFKNKLRLAVNFPSPPAIALQIIELASDPEINVSKVAAMISKDAGLAAKVLRVANSPIYSKRRRSDNLRQALVVLGLNAATTLALSFSLVGTYQRGKGVGIDYGRYWRRAILSASAARTLGERLKAAASEDMFLAALLQDIGVLAVDRVQPDFYCGLPPEATHDDWVAHERRSLGEDHASLGAWLMRNWRLAEPLCTVVESSHEAARLARSAPESLAARCVALASECADFVLGPCSPPGGDAGSAAGIEALAGHAHEWLDLDRSALAEVLAVMVGEIPEIERLFDTPIRDSETATALLDQARELLTLRNLQALEEVSTLRENSEQLEARTTELESRQRRDPLTGVFNRGHLDALLKSEFEHAVAGGWPLSVAFIDLDHFKRINDTFGHAAGDAVLIGAAKLMLECTRETDFVGRYGGEEFVLILPGVGPDLASKVCERLLERLRSQRHTLPAGCARITASIGLATQSRTRGFASVSELLAAADRCVYVAKRAGRDRLVRHEQPADGARCFA